MKYIFKGKLESMSDREVHWLWLIKEHQPERVYYDVLTEEYLVTK